MIPRILFSVIRDRMFKGKAIVLIGPRQVGKTTLVKLCINEADYLFIDGDDPEVRGLLTNAGKSALERIIGQKKIIFIDEAQRIPNVGLLAKIIIDQIPNVQVMISGSSALDINNATQESLTGRKFEFNLLPISWEEFEGDIGFLDAERQLEERLIFGMYPDVINNRSDAALVLKNLTESYLYRDVLSISGIRKPDLWGKLLKALALQMGNEVSYNELANLLEVDKATVARYIDLLEKTFIVFKLSSYSGNQRNEIKLNRKIYFYDNGIRNMIINNLNPLDDRSDKGALWENFLIAERIKHQHYHLMNTQNHFWRNIQKQEIDFVELKDGTITAYEFKWKGKGKKLPSAFLKGYEAQGHVIDRENFRSFVMP